jgi:hypothetical protein
MHSLLWCADVLVAEVSCVYESTEPILQSRPHTNTLTRTAAIVKVLPNLHMYMYIHCNLMKSVSPPFPLQRDKRKRKVI